MEKNVQQSTRFDKVKVQTVSPLIKLFLKKITLDQWKMLQSGSPDDSTRIGLAELLLNIITAVSKTIMVSVKNKCKAVTHEQVKFCLDSNILKGFVMALRLPDQGESFESKRLTNYLIAEITKVVNSALATSDVSAEAVMCDYITAPDTLETMVYHVSQMLSVFMGNTTHKPHLSRRGYILTQDEDAEHSGERHFPQVVCETIHQQLCKEISSLFCAIWNGLSESSFMMLKTEISRVIIFSSEDLAMEFVEIVNEAGPSDECPLSLKDVKGVVQAAFTKCFAILLMQRIKEHMMNRKAVNTNSMEMIMEMLDSLLQPEKDTKEEKMQVIEASDKPLVFTDELSSLFYNHLTNWTLFTIIPESKTNRMKKSPLESLDHIRSVLSGKMWIFRVMMNWWRKTQVENHSQRAAVLVMAALQKCAPISVEARQAEKSKDALKMFTRNLVKGISEKVNTYPPNSKDIIYHLIEITWEQVEGEELDFSPKAAEKQKKAILKDMTKKFGNLDFVLVALSRKDPDTERYIASTMKLHMTKGKKKK